MKSGAPRRGIVSQGGDEEIASLQMRKPSPDGKVTAEVPSGNPGYGQGENFPARGKNRGV